LLKKNNLDAECLENYRPVSNLPYLAKIIERVVARRLTEHMEMNGLVDHYQSAYRRSHSCETALLYVTNHLHKAIDDNNIAVLSLYDLSAAFDTVEHDQLTNSLALIGLTDWTLAWMMDYLSHGKQSVVINNAWSSQASVTCGVPQGSMLGPVLFCVYMQGIQHILKGENIHYALYADDIQVIVIEDAKNVSMALVETQEIASRICTWLTGKRLKMNEAKTEVIVIGGQRALKKFTVPERINICGADIAIASVVRDLGIYLDRSLTLDSYNARI
jgi:hypothetical protein